MILSLFRSLGKYTSAVDKKNKNINWFYTVKSVFKKLNYVIKVKYLGKKKFKFLQSGILDNFYRKH